MSRNIFQNFRARWAKGLSVFFINVIVEVIEMDKIVEAEYRGRRER